MSGFLLSSFFGLSSFGLSSSFGLTTITGGLGFGTGVLSVCCADAATEKQNTNAVVNNNVFNIFISYNFLFSFILVISTKRGKNRVRAVFSKGNINAININFADFTKIQPQNECQRL